MIVHRLFGYPIEIIKECLEAFVAFGLIEIRNYIANQEPLDDECSFHKEYSYAIKITSKGEFFSTFPFIYTDWLFFLSLDSPVHGFYSNSSNYFRAHRDIESTDFLHSFYDAYVITVPNFFKHIVNYSNLKIREFKHILADYPYLSKNFPDAKQLEKQFTLPPWVVDRSIDALVKAAHDRAKHNTGGFAELGSSVLEWRRA